MKPSKKVIILLGPPGSGKGTQAELLSEKLNLYYLETSKIIESHVMDARKGEYVLVGQKKYPLVKERELWKSGILCTPTVVSFWVKKKIKELFTEGRGIVMAGSPRTLPEGKDQIPFLKRACGANSIKVILLELSPEQTFFRNTHRRICELMRHPVLYTKQTAKLKNCPLDGSKLVRRKGLDDPETINTRLKEYKERTYPLVQYFKKQGLKVIKVKGEQSVVDVFKDILNAVR